MYYYKKCVCEYNGTNYSGWQFQNHAETIQQHIEASLAQLYGERVSIMGSGRTDSGVHALGQVFSYRAEKYRDNHSIICAMNSMLPKDIGILSVEDCPPEFNAQFSAVSKTYLYRILNRPTRAAIDAYRVWYRRDPIDVDLLRDIVQPLVGEHDFAAFCVAKSLKENTVRTINFINVERNGDYVELRLNATGFLHNMVRIIVGTAVGLTFDRATPADMVKILASLDRRRSGVTAPPQGLYLEKVYY